MPSQQFTRIRRVSCFAKRTMRRTLSGALLAVVAVLVVPAGASAQACQPAWVPTFGAEGVDLAVDALTTFDDGSGLALYVGGHFATAGGARVNRIARWDGQSWSPLGSGVGPLLYNPKVRALAVFDDGNGPALFVGGGFFTAGDVLFANSIAKWDGQSWSGLEGGLTTGPPGQLPIGSAYALAVFDDGAGPALYVGGLFIFSGGVLTNSIAKWDGTTWSALAGGVGFVKALAVFDDGSGPALYAGGSIAIAGGAPANNIARWDGQSWTSVGMGVDAGAKGAEVDAMTVFDDGSGPALYVSGFFTSAGGVPASNIAKWNGQSWSALGSGVADGGTAGTFASALNVFDDGSGTALYVGGSFTSAGGTPANNIAKWDGVSWSSLDAGVNDAVNALAVFDSGAGPALFVGGEFTSSPAGDAYLAQYQGCAGIAPPSADLNGDGVVNGADLASLLIQWGTDGPADLNSDGVVNGADLATLLTNWGTV